MTTVILVLGDMSLARDARHVDVVCLAPQDCSAMVRQVVVRVERVSMETAVLPALQDTTVSLDANSVIVIWLELLKHDVMLLRGIVCVMIRDSARVRPMHQVSSAIVVNLEPLVYNQTILMAAHSVSALDVQHLALRLA